MKGFTKKLMTIGLAGIMLGGVVGLAGCSKDIDISETERYYYTIKKDIYIVHYENKTATLHKGNLVVEKEASGYSSVSLTPVLKLNCNPEGIPTYLYNPYDTKPDASKYDHICEECFEVFEKQN